MRESSLPMSYEWLAILVALAAFAAANVAAAAVAATCWPLLRARVARVSAEARTQLVVAIRVAPAAAGLLASAITVVAFVRYEPANGADTAGAVLFGSAITACGAVIAAMRRSIARWQATRRFLRRATSTAAPLAIPGVALDAWEIDAAFPIVALAGCWKPRLLVARCVLRDIPAPELQVIFRHEVAHARRRDNAVQMLLTALPDATGLAARWLGLDRAWRDAAEEAADDCATAGDPEARLCLASALVRVARMAQAHPAPAVPLLAFHNGDSVERRVRRLLEAPPPPSTFRALRPALALAALTIALGLWLRKDGVLPSVYHAAEWMVNAWPM